MNKENQKMIQWFKDISMNDLALVGGKNASLGELYNMVDANKHSLVKVPNGFALTTRAYKRIICDDQIKHKLQIILDNIVDINDIDQVETAAKKARYLIYEVSGEKWLHDEIKAAYKELCAMSGNGGDIKIAVRSSGRNLLYFNLN